MPQFCRSGRAGLDELLLYKLIALRIFRGIRKLCSNCGIVWRAAYKDNTSVVGPVGQTAEEQSQPSNRTRAHALRVTDLR